MELPSQYANYPLKNIAQPHSHDVLMGRGGATNVHQGNQHWRLLVAANKELYVSLPKKQKTLLSKSIVHAVRNQQPPGRFLQKDAKTQVWYDVGDERAAEKTSQALREGAAQIRSQGDERQLSVVEVAATLGVSSVDASAPLPPPVPAQGPVSKRKPRSRDNSRDSSPEHDLVAVASEPPQPVAPQELSMGSHFSLTDSVANALLEPNFSIGSVAMPDAPPSNTDTVPNHITPTSVPDSLEPAGLSVGSMMSISTADFIKETGISFGSVMSYTNTSAEPVDGGLQDIGTSFGSMSLGQQHYKPSLPQHAEEGEATAAAVPTFLNQQKSKGNLLDCSDSDEDDDDDARAESSASWQKLQAAFDAQQKADTLTMPPPMSKPPMAVPTEQQDYEAFEQTLLNRGPSLADDEFVVPPMPAVRRKS